MAKPFVTPKGTARWPKLDKPDTKFKEEGEYTIDLVLTADEAQPLIDQITKTREDFYKETCIKEKKKVLKKADLTFFKQEMDDDGNETGRVILKFKAKGAFKKDGKLIPRAKPAVFDSKGKPTKDAVWGGSIVKVSFEPNCWYTAALGVGISLRLCAVQVLELVTKGNGNSDSYGFTEEDGYEAKAVAEENGNAQEPTVPEASTDGDF